MSGIAKYEGKSKGDLRVIVDKKDSQLAELNEYIDVMFREQAVGRYTRGGATAVSSFLLGATIGAAPKTERLIGPIGIRHIAAVIGVGGSFAISMMDEDDEYGRFADILEGVGNAGLVPLAESLGRAAGSKAA